MSKVVAIGQDVAHFEVDDWFFYGAYVGWSDTTVGMLQARTACWLNSLLESIENSARCSVWPAWPYDVSGG